MNSTPLPTTDSIRELAAFWDTHDVTQFNDLLEVVTEPVFERATTIPLSLPDADAARVHELARAQGLDDVDLIRAWVLERLRAA
jgi:hypothetical protein